MADEDTDPNRIDRKKSFYLVLLPDNCDGTVNVNWDGHLGFGDAEVALDHAKEQAEDGSEIILFECIPIKRVSRSQVRVVDIKPTKRPR